MMNSYHYVGHPFIIITLDFMLCVSIMYLCISVLCCVCDWPCDC
jgi:hypothetical protein